MKVLAVGDPHAKLASITEIEMLGDRLCYVFRQDKPDVIVILGDLFNDFAKVHILVMRVVCQFFDKLCALGIPIRYVIGNHDCLNNQVFLEDYHAALPFKYWPNLKVIDKPAEEFGFIFCPYVAAGRFEEALNTGPEWRNARAIFCHQEFRGAKMGAISSLHGDVWDESYPCVISGHIHDYDHLQANVLYMGAPFSQAYSENNDKTVSLFTFGESGVDEERINLGMPRKITLEVNIADLKSLILPENAHVRINLHGTTAEFAAIKKTTEYVELCKNAKVVPKNTDKVVVTSGSIKRTSYLQLLKQACQSESALVRDAFTAISQAGTPYVPSSQELSAV